MKKNSAKFLALLLSATVAVTPSATVLAEGTAEGLPLETDAELELAAEAVDAASEKTEITAETETVDEESVELEEESGLSGEEESEETESVVEEVLKEEQLAGEASTDSKTHSISVTTYNSQGNVSGMYTMDQVIVTEQTDGSYLVRMHQRSANRNYLAITDDEEIANEHEVDWNVGGGSDGYWFTIRLASLDQPLYACFSSADRIAEGKGFSTVQTLIFDTASMTDTEEAAVTASEMTVIPVGSTTPVKPSDEADKEEEKTPSEDTGKEDDKDPSEDTGKEEGQDPADSTDKEETEDPSDDSNKDPEETPGEDTSTLSDGVYTGVATTNAAMFKVTDVKLTSRNGKMKAVVTLSGTGYDYLYMGTKEEAYAAASSSWIPAVVDENGKYTYEIPVEALDTPLAVASRSARYAAEGRGVDAWLERTISIQSDSLLKIADVEEEAEQLEDGIYSGLAETNAAMFKVTAVTLTSKKGVMTAKITLSGTGYDYLYMGSKEEAYAAAASSWIPAVVDENGKYTYEIPVEALDTPLAVASRSARYAEEGKGVDAWLERTVTILGTSLNKTGDLPADEAGDTPEDTKPEEKPSPTPTPKPEEQEASGTEVPKPNDGQKENESKHEADLSGATGAVNSSTTLKDGVYTPSSFSWSGGTGRVKMSCNKVTVTGGKAYATIVFSSNKYGYVKASGNTYYPTISGNSSSFTIPIELNKNNTIIGMTTAMSTPHEIAYNIFVSIPGAGAGGAGDTSDSASGMVSSGNNELDDKAPEIVGLEYKSETELEYAKYFKIYNYDNDITLLEIDLTSDTVRDSALTDKKDSKDQKEEKANTDEKKSASDAQQETAKKTASSGDGEEEDTTVSEEEITAELYQGNVVKYLIVPEGEEVPVGLEKDMVIVQLPCENLYQATESGYANLEELEALNLISSVAEEEKDCENAAIAKAMKDKEIVYGGKAEKPVWKTLIKEGTDLAILSDTLLPGNPEWEKDAKEKDRKDQLKGYDKKDLEKEEKLFSQLTEHFALLGIPVVFDRSMDEKSELAQAEWIKVYGVLTENQKEAEKAFEKTVKEHK